MSTSTLTGTLRDSVDEGVHRLQRTWPQLLATGFVGGLDVSLGVFALLLIKTNSGSDLLASVGFGIGFLALTLANSELYTENFLLPITAVTVKKATWRQVARLWVGTAATNLVGGLTMALLMVKAFPELREAAVQTGVHFIERGLGIEAMLGAVLAGIIITLMTWMQTSSQGQLGSLLAALAAAFLLAYGELGHVIVASVEMFAAMFVGQAPFGPLDWLPLFVQMAIGNAIGGIGLVTVLRLVQLGPDRIERETRRPTSVEDDDDDERDADPRVLLPRN